MTIRTFDNTIFSKLTHKPKTPEERYLCDPEFKQLVDVMISIIHKAQFTPTELREAAILAATKYEMMRGGK